MTDERLRITENNTSILKPAVTPLDTENMSLKDLEKVAGNASTLSENICRSALDPSLGEGSGALIFEQHKTRSKAASEAIAKTVQTKGN